MKTPFRIIFLGVTLMGIARAGDTVRRIELPAETEVFKPADLPGYAVVNASCLTCHSVEYVKYQPPSSPRTYWQATVTKMQKTFGASIPDPLVEPLVDYLSRTYGAEMRNQSAPMPPPNPGKR